MKGGMALTATEEANKPRTRGAQRRILGIDKRVARTVFALVAKAILLWRFARTVLRRVDVLGAEPLKALNPKCRNGYLVGTTSQKRHIKRDKRHWQKQRDFDSSVFSVADAAMPAALVQNGAYFLHLKRCAEAVLAVGQKMGHKNNPADITFAVG